MKREGRGHPWKAARGAPDRVGCEAMEPRLLEAEIGELGGLGDSGVARHVRACEGCAARAARILEGQAALATALADAAAAVAVAADPAQAREGARHEGARREEARHEGVGGGVGGGSPSLPAPQALPARRGRLGIGRANGGPPTIRWRVALPLAAAAAAALALFTRDGPGPGSDLPGAFVELPAWASPVPELTSPPSVVSSRSHRSVAVLPTSNPNITVIWFME